MIDIEHEIQNYEKFLESSLTENPKEAVALRNIAISIYTLFNLRLLRFAQRSGLENSITENDQLNLKFSKLQVYHQDIYSHKNLIDPISTLRNQISHNDTYTPLLQILKNSYADYKGFSGILEGEINKQQEHTNFKRNARDEFAFKKEKVRFWIETIPPTLKANYEKNKAKVNHYISMLENLASVSIENLDDKSIKYLMSAFDSVLDEFEKFIEYIRSYCPDCGSKLEYMEDQRYTFPRHPDYCDEPNGIDWTVKKVCKKCEKDIEILNREHIDI